MSRSIKQGIWIIILGAVLGIASIVYGVTLMFGDSIKMVTPDEQTVSLDSGHYTIYHEYQSTYDGIYFSTFDSNLNGLTFSVLDDRKNTVPVVASVVNSTYTINSRAGQSILSFDILEPGDYHLVAEYDKSVVLLIKKEQIKLFVVYLLTGLLVIGISLLVGIYCLVKKPKYEDDYDY